MSNRSEFSKRFWQLGVFFRKKYENSNENSIFFMKIWFECFQTKKESLKKFSWSLQAYKINLWNKIAQFLEENGFLEKKNQILRCITILPKSNQFNNRLWDVFDEILELLFGSRKCFSCGRIQLRIVYWRNGHMALKEFLKLIFRRNCHTIAASV